MKKNYSIPVLIFVIFIFLLMSVMYYFSLKKTPELKPENAKLIQPTPTIDTTKYNIEILPTKDSSSTSGNIDGK